MSDITLSDAIPVKKTWQECFRIAWHHYSTWFVLALHAALAYFLTQLGPEKQAAIISVVPGLAPFASFIVFVLTKSIPQVLTVKAADPPEPMEPTS